MKTYLDKQKDHWLREITEINTGSFIGIEQPPLSLFEAHYRSDDVFVLASLGQVFGFAFVERRLGEPYIWTIAVRPDQRGHGLGMKILQEIETHYRSLHVYREIALSVRSTNPAQKLYFDAGYRVTKLMRAYYGPGGDGLLMRKTLN